MSGIKVPACGPCDDPNQHRPFEQWMRGSSPKSPAARGVPDLDARIRRIREYAEHFGYVATPWELRFQGEQAEELESLVRRAKALQKDIEKFLAAFKASARTPNA